MKTITSLEVFQEKASAEQEDEERERNTRSTIHHDCEQIHRQLNKVAQVFWEKTDSLFNTMFIK